MNTPAHIAIAASVAKAVPVVPTGSAMLLGSVAPDLPLYLMSFVGGLYFTRVKKMSTKDAADLMFNKLFFENKVWIFFHNVLHAPIVLLSSMLVLAFSISSSLLAAWLFWFCFSCLIHTALDIPTHHNDGPLVWFPFDLKTRFISPISYWDRKRGAVKFMVFEAALVMILLIYLFYPCLSQQLSKLF